MKTKSLLALTCLALAGTGAQAKVVLPNFITDSMVVQRQRTFTIPGKATPNATVRVTPSWNNKTYTATADAQGKFSVTIKTPKAGGPYNITFNDGEETVLRDILSGEVWICSGQSNMEMPVIGWGKIMNYEQETATAAKYPNIRVLQITKHIKYREQEETSVNMGGWRKCSPASINNFSSLAYLFARNLYDKLNIPIGVIDTSWGGTPAESWVNFNTAKETGGFEDYLEQLKKPSFVKDKEQEVATYAQRTKEYNDRIAKEEAAMSLDYSKKVADAKPLTVGKTWESAELPNFDGKVICQNFVNISNPDGDSEIFLGKIDDQDITYINGVQVGTNNNYSVDRKYKIPAGVLKKGENIISVIVSDFAGNGGFWDNVDRYIKTGNDNVSLNSNWTYKVISNYSNKPANPNDPNKPTVLYNGMIYPLRVMPLRGAIWYQGESNEGRDEQYSRLFRGLINNWRDLWGKDMPFYFVQLAGFLQPEQVQPDAIIAALRQAQAEALVLKNTGMATAVDIGDINDIHPKNKQEVARRMALMALKDVYKQNVIDRAPEVKKCTFQDGQCTVEFSGNIHIKGKSVPEGFTIENADGTFTRGTAKLNGTNTIIVKTEKSGTPKSVRYNWANYPDGNIYGANDLPVYPFRSDKLVK